jgi:hypothetical protein
MTDGTRRRRRRAPAARIGVLGASVGGFAAILTALPLHAAADSTGAPDAVVPAVAAVPTTTPRPVVVKIVRRLHVVPGGSAVGATPAPAPSPAPVHVAPPPPPPPAPAPAPDATTHGSR